MTKNLLLALCLAIMPSWAFAELHAEIKDNTTAGGCPKGYPFPEDNLVLIVKDEKSERFNFPFCSSYGRADASIVRDMKNQDFVVLRYGIGRGTNVREEFLIVFKAGEKLEERKIIPISAPSGAVSRWFYDYKVLKPSSGGLQFVLSLKREGTEEIDVPKEKERVINVQ